MHDSKTDNRRIPVLGVYPDNGHSPLALGMILHNVERALPDHFSGLFSFQPNIVSSSEEAINRISETASGILLFSNYIWNNTKNLEIAEEIKLRFPNAITIFGGPEVPKLRPQLTNFLSLNRFVDLAVVGEGEATAIEIFERLARAISDKRECYTYLAGTKGIGYRTGNASSQIVCSAARDRIVDLDTLRSPYVDSWFTEHNVSKWAAAILETNRGCPYGCAFCDWGSATLSKIRQFDVERVSEEIRWIARNQVGILWIADANFGIFERDVAIAEEIARTKLATGFPKQVVVNYAKNATNRLARIIQIFKSSGVRADAQIAIQTNDATTLKNIRRANIKTERYDELIDIFHRFRMPISTDLMIGLPGSNVEKFLSDLQFSFDRKVYAKVHSTQVLVNSPLAEPSFQERFGIELDSDGKIASTDSFNSADLKEMEGIRTLYEIFVGFSTLKYFLYFLQVDHDIEISSFLREFHSAIQHESHLLNSRSLVSAFEQISDEDTYESLLLSIDTQTWERIFEEVNRFIQTTFGVFGTDIDVALLSQRKLIPGADRILPENIEVQHDFELYFEQVDAVSSLDEIKKNAHCYLRDHKASSLYIHDPKKLCDSAKNSKMLYDTRGIDWELSSRRNIDVVSHLFDSQLLTGS